MGVDRFDLDVSYFSVSVPVLFFLAAVDFLLRMDFVMLVIVISLFFLLFLFFFFFWPDQGQRVEVQGLLWLSSSDDYK